MEFFLLDSIPVDENGSMDNGAQKELVYNKLLPYGEKLDEEAAQFLNEIKSKLAQCVLLREINPGAIHWIFHLNSYIRLYGRKFKKEDHVQLIHFLLEIISIPNLDLGIVLQVSTFLQTILKKRYLLSRDDLVIPWRPLYNLFERALYSPYEHLGILLVPSTKQFLSKRTFTSVLYRNLENSLKGLIRSCRVYFSVESTKEMMEEWTPLMCPFDVTMHKALQYFELFLPTTLPPSQHDRGFKLWFQEFIDLWQNCHNSPCWENNLVSLFSRLAYENMGYIDWEPYIPLIFTRLLRSFDLPVASGKVQVSRRGNAFDSLATVNWITALLGGSSSCQIYVSRMFKAVESYYHPSNNGRWVMKLQRILYKLPAAVIRRLHRERYKQPSWETPVPSSHRLTDENVTQFVESIQPVVLLAMFSKGGSSSSAAALQNLSLIRPEMVIPPVLERLYSSLETLTEPHRLTAAMHCVVSVARNLVLSGTRYPEGPSHVIPLLLGSLPGIDPNDIKKCMVTFQFISTFTTLIPLMDCSKAVQVRTDLNEQEQELCLATAEFENFVLQFMGRCFALIENSSLENPTRLDRETDRMNAEENIMEVGLASTFSSILTQCSPEIYEAALKKLHSFVSNRILETKVSGRYVANMCRSAARVNPPVALRTFVPHFGKLVMALTESDDVATEEILDDELLFSLLLLSEVVRCNGVALLEYVPILIKVLHRTLHLSSRQGYLLASALLRNLLRSLSLVFPLDFRSSNIPWNELQNFQNNLPVKDWGKAGNLHDLGIKWHVPKDEEITCARELLDEFLYPELNLLEKWHSGEKNLTREEVQRSLNIILDCVLGAGCILPMWSGEPKNLTGTLVSTSYLHVQETGSRRIDFQTGENVREKVVTVIRKVLNHTMETREDDIKSSLLIIKIYHELVFYWGVSKDDFDTRWKGFHVVKKALENRLASNKQHIRALLIDRTQLQHEMRVMEKYRSWFTDTHKELMADLLKLSIGHYSEVRTKAQEVLQKFFCSFNKSYKFLVQDMVSILSNNLEVSHDQLKGVLYILLGKNQKNTITLPDWSSLLEIWPALVKAKHSEKPSIIWLLDRLLETLQRYLETSQIKLEVSESCLQKADELVSNKAFLPDFTPLTEEQKQEGANLEQKRNSDRLRCYEELVGKLVDSIESGSLHWRHYHLALVMLRLLIRYDVQVPPKAVKTFVKHLVHDTVSMRKVAILGVSGILKLLKRPHVKRELDPSTVDINSIRLSSSLSALLGNKKPPENIWLQFNSSYHPYTREDWDKAIFVHKTYVGFSTWPSPLLVYDTDDKQPKLDRTREELSESEAAIYDAFSSQSFVDQLMAYLSLEERKGHDHFDAKRFYMFKGLFRNFGNAFVPLFEKHLKQKLADSQESNQRCSLEVIAGIMRGSKHWNYDMMQSLKTVLEPIFKGGFSSITPETLADWGTCVATISESRDPNKYHWFFELLMANPLNREDGSFLQSSRLYLLLGGLAQQEWRVCELLHRQLEYLKPHMTHNYENVRERIGSLLCTIFLYDVHLPLYSKTLSLVPKRMQFVSSVLPLLVTLYSEFNLRTDDSITMPPESMDVDDKKEVLRGDGPRNNHVVEQGASSERKAVVRLLQTVSKWMLATIAQCPSSAPPEMFKILPLLCQMQSDNTDEEVQKDCAVTLALMGNSLLPHASIEAALNTVREITESQSWHARAAACNFLQFMIFSNLFTVQSNASWSQYIVDYILTLLKDERLEVRETAAETLGGLLHCEFLKVTEELLASFKAQCSKKLKKKRSATNEVCLIDPKDLILRHAGILGLCACVNAYPYDVPGFMPDILVILGDHLHDPQPIPTTIKKCLSNFRRTHHDNWRDHKVKFTDDQLVVITDLLVSPSYYA